MGFDELEDAMDESNPAPDAYEDLERFTDDDGNVIADHPDDLPDDETSDDSEGESEYFDDLDDEEDGSE